MYGLGVLSNSRVRSSYIHVCGACTAGIYYKAVVHMCVWDMHGRYILQGSSAHVCVGHARQVLQGRIVLMCVWDMHGRYILQGMSAHVCGTEQILYRESPNHQQEFLMVASCVYVLQL